jgi:hypothetical protein
LTLIVFEVFLAAARNERMPLRLTHDLIVVAPDMDAAAAWIEQTYQTQDYLIREFGDVAALVEIKAPTHPAPRSIN